MTDDVKTVTAESWEEALELMRKAAEEEGDSQTDKFIRVKVCIIVTVFGKKFKICT